MANEQIRTISQIKIGDNFYNIKDAQVRQVLTNLTTNVITFRTFYHADYNYSNTVPIYGTVSSGGSNLLLIPTCAVKCWITKVDEKLHYASSVASGSQYNWQGISTNSNDNTIVDQTPEKVEECILLLQYRIRSRMKKAGTFHYDMVRRPITQSSHVGRSPLNNNDFASLPNTVQFYDKGHSASKEVNFNTSWNDRIVKSNNDYNGFEYRMRIYKYVQDGSDTTAFTVNGVVGRTILIVKGVSTRQLIPADEPIIDSETPAEGDQNEDE